MDASKYVNMGRIAIRNEERGNGNIIDAIISTDVIKESIRSAINEYLRQIANAKNITDSSLCVLEDYVFSCDEINTDVKGEYC